MDKRNQTPVLQIDERATELYWKNRKIDWHQAYFTPKHCHREQLMGVLKELEFKSVIEVGCGAGANLWKIKEQFPDVLVAGIDINEDAVRETLKRFPAEIGIVESIDHPDKCVDLLLTDACLIYVPPEKIEIAIKEMLRVARKYIVMCEWDNDKDIFDGHWIYDYENLFREYDVKKTKITGWGGNWGKYGQIIVIDVESK